MRGSVWIGEQVVGAVERDEALGVPRDLEDPARVRDGNHRVARAVEDQERSVELGDRRFASRLAQVVEELAPDPKRTACDRHDGLAVAFDRRQVSREQAAHVLRRERRADGRDGLRFRQLSGGGEHGRAAEAVADEQARRPDGLLQVVRGRDEVLDIGREGRVREVALASNRGR